MEHINKSDISINVSSSRRLWMGNIWGVLLTPLLTRKGKNLPITACDEWERGGRGWGMIGMHQWVSSWQRLWPWLRPAGSAVTSTPSWDQFKGYPADTCPPSARARTNGCAANGVADGGGELPCPPETPIQCTSRLPATGWQIRTFWKLRNRVVGRLFHPWNSSSSLVRGSF